MLYALRAVYTLIHFLAVCTYALVYCLLRPRQRNATSYLARLMSGALPVLGIKLIKQNPLPTVPNQQAVYVINHQDVLDIFIYTGALPQNIAILGKTDLRYVPIFGLAFWLAGNIFIDRGNKARAWETMHNLVKTIKTRGCSMYMFPEGTRSHGKGLLPFKTGAFALAVESGLPIIPIVFSSTHKHIDLHRWHAGTAMVRHLEPIYTEGLTQEDVKPLMERTRNTMQAAINHLDQEVVAYEHAHRVNKANLSQQISKYLKSR